MVLMPGSTLIVRTDAGPALARVMGFEVRDGAWCVLAEYQGEHGLVRLTWRLSLVREETAAVVDQRTGEVARRERDALGVAGRAEAWR